MNDTLEAIIGIIIFLCAIILFAYSRFYLGYDMTEIQYTVEMWHHILAVILLLGASMYFLKPNK